MGTWKTVWVRSACNGGFDRASSRGVKEKRLFYGAALCSSQYLSGYKRSRSGVLCLPFYLPGVLLVRRHDAYSLLGEHRDQYYGYWRGNAWWFLGTCRPGR